MASALRTDLKGVLADVPAVVADGVAAVECEVVRAVVSRRLEQLAVLVLGQMLGHVHMQGRSAVKMLDIFIAVQLELVDHRQGVVLRIVEVRAVHIVLRRDVEAVLLVPLVVLAGKVLARNELGVEHRVGGLVLLVGAVDGLQDDVHELVVLRVRADGKSQELSGVGKTVHTDGKVLPFHIDEASLIDIQHMRGEEVLDDLVESLLVLVNPLGLLGHGLTDIFIKLVLVVVGPGKRLGAVDDNAFLLKEVASGGKLDEPVQVDGHHRL